MQETNENFYKDTLIEIAQLIYDNAGIELPQQGIKFEVFRNKKIQYLYKVNYLIVAPFDAT